MYSTLPYPTSTGPLQLPGMCNQLRQVPTYLGTLPWMPQHRLQRLGRQAGQGRAAQVQYAGVDAEQVLSFPLLVPGTPLWVPLQARVQDAPPQWSRPASQPPQGAPCRPVILRVPLCCSSLHSKPVIYLRVTTPRTGTLPSCCAVQIARPATCRVYLYLWPVPVLRQVYLSTCGRYSTPSTVPYLTWAARLRRQQRQTHR